MHSRSLTLLGLTAATLAVGAPAFAGGGHAACPAFATGETDVIELRDSCFAPISATAKAGSTVTITNVGTMPHTFTALDGSFDSDTIEPGASVTIDLPDTPGTLPVHCTLHADRAGNGMAGTITLDTLSAAPVSAAASGSLVSSGVALAGGFVMGSATIAAVRRRDLRRASEEARP